MVREKNRKIIRIKYYLFGAVKFDHITLGKIGSKKRQVIVFVLHGKTNRQSFTQI